MDNVFRSIRLLKNFFCMGKSQTSLTIVWDNRYSLTGQVRSSHFQISALFFINCLLETQMAVCILIHSLFIWALWSKEMESKAKQKQKPEKCSPNPEACKEIVQLCNLLWDNTRKLQIYLKQITNFCY